MPCTTAIVPPWPKAGAAVAVELDRVCPIKVAEDGTEISSCPAIDAWHERLGKFQKKLGEIK